MNISQISYTNDTPKSPNKMATVLEILVFAFGVSLATPGISFITLSGFSLQPFYVLAAAITCIGFYEEKIPKIFILLCYVSSLVITGFLSLSFSEVGNIFILAFDITSLAISSLGIYIVLSKPNLLKRFLQGFIIAVSISGLVAAFQSIYSIVYSKKILLTNNGNYSLISPFGRGAAFAPEPAFLGGIIGFCLIFFSWKRLIYWVFSSRILIILLLVSILLGLLATRSSSTIVYLSIAAISFVIDSKDAGAALKKTLIVLTLGACFVAAAYPLYLERVAKSDATLSALYRAEKMATAANIWSENTLIGAGPGALSDASYFTSQSVYLTQYGRTPNALRQGVDSEVLRVLAENGVVGALTRYLPLLIGLLVLLRARFKPGLEVSILLFPVIFWLSFVSGYRDSPLSFVLLSAALFTVENSRSVQTYLRQLRGYRRSGTNLYAKRRFKKIDSLGDQN